MENKLIQIREVNREEAAKINKELIDFNPEKCLACGNKKDIIQRFFLLNIPVKNEIIHKKVKKILRDKYGLTYYGYSENNKNLITTAKCPECDGEKMDWDY